MKDFMSLRIIDRFRSIFLKLEINYDIMRRILQLKLIMDERRVPTALYNDKKNKDENLLKKSLFSYGLIGLFIMFIVIIPFPIYIQMSLCFGMLMFMIMMTMIADFSSVLLDVKGRNIFLTKPIDRKTFNSAKLIHIFIYMFTITTVMAVPALIAGTIKYGVIFFLLFTVEIILLAGLVVFLASLLYSIVLRLFDGEKLKDIINYVQIILSITMIIAYQLIGRMFDIIDINIASEPKWWSALIPPAWFAAPFELFINSNNGRLYILLSILSVLIPIVTLVIYIKLVVPRFENDLSKLNNSSGSNRANQEKIGHFKKKLTKIFSSNVMENVFLRFTQNMLSKERALKLKIYPNLALSTVFPFLMLLPFVHGASSLSDFFNVISESKAYFSIYITVLMISSTVFMITTSEYFKGSWIYKTLPIESFEPIYKGALKGYLLKYCIPIYLFVSTIFIFVYKFTIIIDLILILTGMVLFSLIVTRNIKMGLPFSEDVQKTQSGNTAVFFTILISIGIFAGLHLLIRNINFLLFIAYTIIVILGTFVFWRKSFKTKIV